MICCDRDVSSDDTIETVYVRNSRNCLQAKLFIYICGMMLYVQLCLWQMLIGDWFVYRIPHVVMGRQGVYMSGMVGIRLLTSYHVLGRISGLYQNIVLFGNNNCFKMGSSLGALLKTRNRILKWP